MALFEYMKQTQRFLRDGKQELINPADLIIYINRARREVAMRSECIRFLPPISGGIKTATIQASGNGFTVAPLVTISTPDFPSGTLPSPNGLQATAIAAISAGTVSSVSITSVGAGYFQPIMTASGGGGSGVSIAPNLSFVNELSQGQEVYPFSSVDLTTFPGPGNLASIFQIKSVSLIYSNYRYSLPCYSFSTYQAMIRQYSSQYQYVSTFCAQFGQGVAGSFYMYPLPSQAYQMEWDCICLPADLSLDADAEAIPQPWTDIVPHFAAYLAFIELQSWNNARAHEAQFDKYMTRYGSYTRPGRITNPYGRY